MISKAGADVLRTIASSNLLLTLADLEHVFFRVAVASFMFTASFTVCLKINANKPAENT